MPSRYGPSRVPTYDELTLCFYLQGGRLYNKAWRRKPHAEATGSMRTGGYMQLEFVLHGMRLRVDTHVAVWALANGRMPDPGMVIDHGDSNRENFKLGNLEEITQQENTSRRRPRTAVHADKATLRAYAKSLGWERARIDRALNY